VATVLAIPAAVYSAFMFITAGTFAWLMYKRNVRSDDELPARADDRAVLQGARRL
jgi:hypothetical protein